VHSRKSPSVLRRIREFFSRRAGKKSKYPTPLPSHISDNQYLAASAHAGQVDRGTGAYDKYLFEDQEIPEMPYETAVDDHLELMSLRLSQRFRRFISKAENNRIKASRALEREQIRQDSLLNSKLRVEQQIEHQARVLAGEVPGRQGLNWPGESPQLVSVLASRIRLASRYIVFLAIAAVDLWIIQRSLTNLNIQFQESWLLTFPAVSAQLVFPHLAGIRRSYLVRGMHRKISPWLELLVLLGLWIAFISVMTDIRVRFIVSEIQLYDANMPPELVLTFRVLNAVLLLALGGWLIFLAVRENPHEIESLRAQIKLSMTERKIASSAQRSLSASKKLEEAESS